MKMEQSVPKHWHIKFRRRGITQIYFVPKEVRSAECKQKSGRDNGKNTTTLQCQTMGNTKMTESISEGRQTTRKHSIPLKRQIDEKQKSV
jgi:hypothetical protein